MKIKGGSFKTMQLNKTIFNNISFKNPTPIQRKSIPHILSGTNVVGIARTGSGKTHAYLLPVLHRILNGEKAMVIVPTRELCYQVLKMAKNLVRGGRDEENKIRMAVFHGEIPEQKINHDLIIGTVGRLNYSQLPHVDILVVDEVDRILDDGNMKIDFYGVRDRVSATQHVYFSATLPEDAITLVTDFKIIKIDNELSPTLKNYFFYVFNEKVSALLKIMKKVEGKTIIFTTHKYGVELLSEALLCYKHVFIHSGLDQEMRQQCMRSFADETDVLIVTDLASRGLDIPSLANIINFDLCDTKTFLHRVGRVGRCGRVGHAYSLVSYDDYFHFCAIREELLPQVEIGLIPLNEPAPVLNSGKIYRAEKAYKKAALFNKVTVQADKSEIATLRMHSLFADEENEKIKFLRPLQKKQSVEMGKIDSNLQKKSYEDQFFIPYASKGLHSMVEKVQNDSLEKVAFKRNKIKK